MVEGLPLVTDPAELERLYGAPAAASVLKETDRLTPAYRALVEASPFLLLATAGPDGLDCSPRGDAPGFVRVADERTLLLPDRRGNNRIDSLRNILHDPRVALLFLLPGMGETLRVNGRAAICADPGFCDGFAVEGKAPRSVLVVAVERVFFQCARATLRGGLWDPARWPDRSALPTAGTMLAEASRGAEGGAAYDADLPGRVARTLY